MSDRTGKRRQTNLIPIVLVAISTVGFALSQALVRWVSSDLHVFEIVFFRNLFGLACLAPWIIASGRKVLATSQLPLHLVRILLSLISLYAFFFALSLSPLAMVAAMSFTAPMFTTVLAWLFLREVVRLRRWSAIMAGFLGVLIVMRSGAGAMDTGLLLALGASVTFAIMLAMLKKLSYQDSPLTVTAYGMLVMTPITLVPALLVWQTPSPPELLALFGIGALTSGNIMLFMIALKDADIGVLMPLDYLRLLWTVILGYFLFGELPDVVAVVGMLMIASSAAYIAWRERNLQSTGG